MARRRLDAEMVARGLAEDREQAARTIEERVVVVDDAPGLKAETLVSTSSRIRLIPPKGPVSRAGLKLAGAIEEFGIEVKGMRCLDAGAGSGGFTEVLLNAGAVSVAAVDVGYGQFDYRLRIDPRVTLRERTNVRRLLPAHASSFDLVVADLSFVSLRSMLPTLARLGTDDATLLMLVKPQFEIEASLVGAGGIVNEPALWESAIGSVCEGLEALGFGAENIAPSRVKGAEGNQEFFVAARRGLRTPPGLIAAAVNEPK
jgi:23S rRNA (cytidine1920-2'-O)/16S rRNA (cytidine1409-2'-O)-methyltransferase